MLVSGGSRTKRDHPRSRGDNEHLQWMARNTPGSPPLTRGQPYGEYVSCPSCRITPAHAGTTQLVHYPCRTLWDHPRSRGDNLPLAKMRIATMGSPPLTRGQLRPPADFGVPVRITPAHAGTTPFPSQVQAQCRDHPRSRGDNLRHER